MTGTPAVGFIAPPGWPDPSPAEFPQVCAGPVATRQVPLRAPAFDWRLDSAAGLEAEVALAAATLSAMGCAVAAKCGTPFGWLGTEGPAEARARGGRLSDAAGIPVLTAGLAILDALEALGARRVALACTYYSAAWSERWAGFVASAGYEVSVASLADLGLRPEPADEAFDAPSGDEIARNVRGLLAQRPGADAVAIAGAGARTLPLIAPLEAETGLPVVGADTTLYRAAARAAGVRLAPGALGRIGEV